MTSKLGFNVQQLHRRTEYDARLLNMPLGGLTVIGDSSSLEWASQFTCPVVFRFSALDDSAGGGKYASQYGKGDPKALGAAFVREVRTLIGPKYRQFYYQAGWDEVKDHWEWSRDFTIAALEEADKDHLKLCVINLFWGNPPESGRFPVTDSYDGWDILWPAVAEAAARHDRAIIGLHAYIDPRAEMSIEGQRHALTRPLHLIEKARAVGLRVRIGLTETGLTVRYHESRYPSLAAYGNALCAADGFFTSYPEIEFENIYTLDKLDGNGVYPADREIFNVVEAYNKLSPSQSGPIIEVPAPVPQPYVRDVKVVYTVNQRAAPDRVSALLGAVQPGARLRVEYPSSGGYVKVIGQGCYVLSNNLQTL